MAFKVSSDLVKYTFPALSLRISLYHVVLMLQATLFVISYITPCFIMFFSISCLCLLPLLGMSLLPFLHGRLLNIVPHSGKASTASLPTSSGFHQYLMYIITTYCKPLPPCWSGWEGPHSCRTNRRSIHSPDKLRVGNTRGYCWNKWEVYGNQGGWIGWWRPSNVRRGKIVTCWLFL